MVLFALLALGLTPSAYTRRPSASHRAHPSMAADRCGLLCVGLAGNNGVTLVAGQIANQRRLKWESSRDGPKEANCLGCITQNGALARKHEFAAFEDVAVGGWDVVPTGLGDALYHSRILEYDLVRQVREEMNTWPVMPGVFDPEFVGESQHEGATQVRTDLSSRSAELAALREDIVRFKREQQVTGHCTVHQP
jgi:myo-inositol-1-phosphate synthase